MEETDAKIDITVENNLSKFIEMTKDMKQSEVAEAIMYGEGQNGSNKFADKIQKVMEESHRRNTYGDIAELQGMLEEYQIATGMVTREELEQESARLAAAERIRGEDIQDKRVPANRAERRAAAKRARKI